MNFAFLSSFKVDLAFFMAMDCLFSISNSCDMSNYSLGCGSSISDSLKAGECTPSAELFDLFSNVSPLFSEIELMFTPKPPPVLY